jgi:bifunctional ADP-heptose synthase (sugar kinase/adenylyltransferase)
LKNRRKSTPADPIIADFSQYVNATLLTPGRLDLTLCSRK